jgi:hypothetical protein
MVAKDQAELEGVYPPKGVNIGVQTEKRELTDAERIHAFRVMVNKLRAQQLAEEAARARTAPADESAIGPCGNNPNG